MKFLPSVLIAYLFCSDVISTEVGNLRLLQSHSVPTIYDKIGNYSKQNCGQYVSGYCRKCSYRYSWQAVPNGIDFNCVVVSDKCKAWDERTGRCT